MFSTWSDYIPPHFIFLNHFMKVSMTYRKLYMINSCNFVSMETDYTHETVTTIYTVNICVTPKVSPRPIHSFIIIPIIIILCVYGKNT